MEGLTFSDLEGRRGGVVFRGEGMGEDDVVMEDMRRKRDSEIVRTEKERLMWEEERTKYESAKSPMNSKRIKSPVNQDVMKISFISDKIPMNHERPKTPAAQGRVKTLMNHESVKTPLKHERVKTPVRQERVPIPVDHEIIQTSFSCTKCNIPIPDQGQLDIHNTVMHTNYEMETKCSKTFEEVKYEVKEELPEEYPRLIPSPLVTMEEAGEEIDADNSDILYCETEGCKFSTEDKNELKSHILSFHFGLSSLTHKTESPTFNEDDETFEPESEDDEVEFGPDGEPLVRAPESKFICERCNFGSAHSGNLKRHMETVHGKPRDVKKRKSPGEYDDVDPSKLLRCDKCDFITPHYTSIKRHKMVKHEGQRFSCEKCSFQASQQYDLKKHMKKKHNDFDVQKLE